MITSWSITRYFLACRKKASVVTVVRFPKVAERPWDGCKARVIHASIRIDTCLWISVLDSNCLLKPEKIVFVRSRVVRFNSLLKLIIAKWRENPYYVTSAHSSKEYKLWRASQTVNSLGRYKSRKTISSTKPPINQQDAQTPHCHLTSRHH